MQHLSGSGRRWPRWPPPPNRTARTDQVSRSSISRGNNNSRAQVRGTFFFTFLAPRLSPQKDCRVKGCLLARAGSLLTSGSPLWCSALPSRFPLWFAGPSILPLYLDSLWSPTLPFVCGFPQPKRVVLACCGVVRVFSSTLLPGFSGPESSVLSADLPSSVPSPIRVSLSSVPFYGPLYPARTGGLPRVRSHRLPISRPTSPQIGSPDIRTRSDTPARPPPRSHIVGSLFATYMGSASCFLQTSHLWVCPCPVGVALPSGNGGLLLIRRLRHAGRT
jgi:hypothetical protein